MRVEGQGKKRERKKGQNKLIHTRTLPPLHNRNHHNIDRIDILSTFFTVSSMQSVTLLVMAPGLEGYLLISQW